MEIKRCESLPLVIAKYASSNLYRQALGLLTAILRPKLLTPELYGLWTLLKVIPRYTTYLHFGSRFSMRYLIPYYVSKNDSVTLAQIRETTLGSSLLAHCLAGAGIAIVVLQGNYSSVENAGLIVMIFLVMMQVYYEFFIDLLKGYEKFSSITAANYLETTLVFLLTIPLLYYYQIYGLFISLLISQVVVIFYLRSKCEWEIRVGFAFRTFRELISKGLPIMIYNLSSELVVTSDRFVVSHLLGMEQLGYYGIATMVVGFLMNVPGAARQVLEPRLMRTIERAPAEDVVNEYLLRPLINTAYLIPFLIGPIFLALPSVIPAILPRYMPSIIPTQILACGVYFLALSYAPRALIIANHWQMIASLLLPAVILVNISLSFFLVKQGLGLFGVALSNAASFLLIFLVLFGILAVNLERKGSNWSRHVAGMFLPFPMMCGILYGLTYWIPNMAENDILAIIIETVIYCSIMFLFHIWSSRKLPLLKPIMFASFWSRK